MPRAVVASSTLPTSGIVRRRRHRQVATTQPMTKGVNDGADRETLTRRGFERMIATVTILVDILEVGVGAKRQQATNQTPAKHVRNGSKQPTNLHTTVRIYCCNLVKVRGPELSHEPQASMPPEPARSITRGRVI